MARFDDLLKGYRDDELAASDLEEFLALLEADASPMAAPILEDLRRNAFAGYSHPAQRARMLAQVLNHSRSNNSRLIRLLQRTAAAAIFIGLMLAGYLWLYHPAGSGGRIAQKTGKDDVAPGTNNATLPARMAPPSPRATPATASLPDKAMPNSSRPAINSPTILEPEPES